MVSTNPRYSRSWQASWAVALVCCAGPADKSGSAAALPGNAPPFPTSGAVQAGEPPAPTADPAATPSAATGAAAPTSEGPGSPDLVQGTPGSGAAAPGNPGAGGSAGPGAPAPGAAGSGGAMVNPSDPSAQPQPSAKCGSGGSSPTFNLPNTLFSVPASYDGSTPLPVVIAFHAAGNPNTQLRGILGGTLQNDYILFYPKSDGNGWVNGTDAPKVDAIFNALDASACYDKHRVFATGHSSGAQFIVQRLCAGEDRWRAVATVASSVYCSSWQPLPALVIHGIGDTERQAYGLNDGEGLKDIVPYRTSNGCQESYTEVPVDGCSSGGVQVDPGCRDFNGCSETTRWCQHNDPQYGTSHHGVPCFGARVIKQFFDTYR